MECVAEGALRERQADAAEQLLQRGLPPGALFIEDGSSPQIVAGPSTIGLELAAQWPAEVVIAPVGNGALIGGLATALKAANPTIETIGVQSSASPCI